MDGFTTLSDEELSGNVNTIIDSPKKSGGEKSTVKKTGTMAKNFTSKRLTRVKSSKKRAEDNEGEKTSSKKDPKKNMKKKSSPLKEHGAMKEPVKKKHPKQKNTMKAANTSAKKGKGMKFEREKKSNDVNAGGYGQTKLSNKRKGKVTVIEFDSDDDSLGLDDEEEYAHLLEQVKQESKRDIKPLLISVSPPFANVTNGFAYYLITFPKAGKLFLLKPEFYVTNIKIVYKNVKHWLQS